MLSSKKHKKGGFGIVNISQRQGNKYAIKEFIKNDLTTEVLREICYSRLLNHPNCIKVIDIIYARERFQIKMEYGGISLREYQKISLQGERINICMSVMCQIVAGIDYLHSNGLCHRDIKPDNILINNDIIKLCDFGLITEYMDDLPACSIYYKPPELYLSDVHNEKIDIWALGCTLYEFINDSILFNVRGGSNILRKIARIIPITQEQLNMFGLDDELPNDSYKFDIINNITNQTHRQILMNYKLYIYRMLVISPDDRASSDELRFELGLDDPDIIPRAYRKLEQALNINYQRREKSIELLRRINLPSRTLFLTISIIDFIIERREISSLDVYSALSLAGKFCGDIVNIDDRYTVEEINMCEKRLLTFLDYNLTNTLIYSDDSYIFDKLIEILLDRKKIEGLPLSAINAQVM